MKCVVSSAMQLQYTIYKGYIYRNDCAHILDIKWMKKMLNSVNIINSI